MRKVTIKEIAKYCGVSITTVSFVLNGKTSEVSEKTIKKVKEAARELGYSRNEVARSLVTNKTEMIAMIVPDVTNMFYASIIKTANQVAMENGYNILLCDTNNSVEKEVIQIQLLDNQQIDGIIVASRNSKSLIEKFRNKRNVPIVIIDEEVEDLPNNIFSVATDNVLSGYNITKSIIKYGHKNLFILGGLKDSTNSKLRNKGVFKALKEFGIPSGNCKIMYADYKMKQAYEVIKNHYSSRYTAIIAFNDLMAYGAIKSLSEMNVNVPQDTSVVGFDANVNLNLITELSSIDLTSINQNEVHIGRKSVEILLDYINNKDRNNKSYLLNASMHYGNTLKEVNKKLK